MLDYIDILLQALYEDGADYLNGEFYLQSAREKHAEEALTAALSDAQIDLYLAYESAQNAAAEIYTKAVARQAFLLAKEIYQ